MFVSCLDTKVIMTYQTFSTLYYKNIVMVIYFSQKICDITCTCSCIDVDCDMEHYTSQCLCIQKDKKKIITAMNQLQINRRNVKNIIYIISNLTINLSYD